MNDTDTLFTIAEVSVAFAGFSGIIVAFARRDPGEWSFVEQFRFRALVETSVGGSFLALAAAGLASTPLSPSVAWQSSSLLMLTYLVASYVATVRRLRASVPEERTEVSPSFLGAIVTCDALIAALNIFNVVSSRAAWPLVIALILLVGQSAFFFARLLIAAFGRRSA